MKFVEPTKPHRKSGTWGTRGSVEGDRVRGSLEGWTKGEAAACTKSRCGEGRTADLSTTLRYAPVEMTIHFEGKFRFSRKSTKASSQQTCHLDRSVAQWRDLRFLWLLPYKTGGEEAVARVEAGEGA
jgi:hypothetical protein